MRASSNLAYELAALLLRNGRLIIGVVVLVAAATAVALLFLGREYTARSAIVPEASDTRAMPLAGLAAQFGVSLSGSSGGESVDFYSRLLRSRQLLEAAGLSRYRFVTEIGGEEVLEGTLLELYDVEGEHQRDRVRRLVDRLLEDVEVSTDVRANLLGIATTAPWPLLAEALNQRLLDLMGEFNLEKRQSKAAAERQFVEARMAEARSDLASAEAELRSFREQNRRLGASPELELEAQRLEREVSLRQQVYTSLAQAYEQARIDEVRNTPVFTVVDPPAGSARPDRGMVSTLLMGVFLGTIAGVTLALARESLARMRRDHPERAAELRSLAGGIFLPGRRDRGRTASASAGSGRGRADGEHSGETPAREPVDAGA